MNIFICDDNEADIAQIRSYTKIYFASVLCRYCKIYLYIFFKI